VIALISAAFMPGPGMMSGQTMGGGDVSIKTPGGEVTVNQGKLEDLAKKMEEAGKQMEAATKSGDMAAVAQAGAAIAGAAATSAGGRTPIAAQELKAMLPQGIGSLKRESIEAQGNQAAGFAMSSARAEYGGGDRRITLAINDAGALAGLAGIANWMNVSSDKETADSIERIYKEGNRTVRERQDKKGGSAEFALVMSNGVIIEADGDGVDLAELKSAVAGLPLARLEAAK
jgi:hypothetical protein